MKAEIHPAYVETKVTCGCGEVFTTRSTKETGSIYVEVCSVCHPFYTGKQRILDTGGRVAKFQERFGKSEKPGTKQFSKRERTSRQLMWCALFFIILKVVNPKIKKGAAKWNGLQKLMN